jgi:hypothetical protein
VQRCLPGDTQEITECRRRRQAATTSPPSLSSTPDANDLDLDAEDLRREQQREPHLDQRERSPQWIGLMSPTKLKADQS